MAIENFAVNTLIIPMDVAYQNAGMLKAYGLVYELLSNGIPVKWAIQPGKTFDGTDFTANAVDVQTLAAIINHNYTGGPFIIDSAFAAAAMPIITAWQALYPVKVHRATAPFSADIASTMTHAPLIAVEETNSSIMFKYLNGASIPDSLGNVWTNASPDVLDEVDMGNGAFFGGPRPAPPAPDCRRIKYDIFLSPHTSDGTWTDPVRKYELDEYVRKGGFLHATCHSVLSIENFAGPFLTQAGIPTTDLNKGNSSTFTVDVPDFPSAQAVSTGQQQALPGGSFETVYHNTPGLVYNAETQILAHFIETNTSKQYDFMFAGPYKNGTGAGKIVYEGGHDYSPTQTYTTNDENLYTRFVLDSIFFAITKPLVRLMYSTANPNDILYQNIINTINFEIVNEGASNALNQSFSVTLAPGVNYNGDATIPPSSVIGQTLIWSNLALGTVPPGPVLTFTADYMPAALGIVKIADFTTSFGDNWEENYSAVGCRSAQVEQFETAELDMVKSVDLTFAEGGDTLTYTIDVTNTSAFGLAADNVVFTDPIPAGSTFVPGSLTINGGPNPGDPSAGVSLGSIPAGGSVQVIFQVLIGDNDPIIDIVNQAFADFSFTNTDGTFDSSAESNIVITQVEEGQLTAIKSADATVATIGDTITYTVVVTNTGTVTATNVNFTDTPPAGTTYVPGSVTVGGVPQPGFIPMAGFNIGTIPVGGSVAVTFQAIVTSIPDPTSAANTADLTFMYRVNPAGPDLQGFAVSNPVIIQLVTPEINIVKSSDIAFADIGDIITYTMIVTNTGDVTANNVVFTDTPPAGTTFVPGSITVNGAPTPGNPSSGIPIGNMAPGASIPVTFQVTATSVPVPNPTTNTANAQGSFIIEPGEPPRILDFDSNPVDVTIEQTGVNVVKSVDKAFAEVGETLTYTVEVTNTGTVSADNSVLTDIVPNGTTFIPGTVTINGFPSGADPNAGIPLGSIPSGGNVEVIFQVTLDSIPVPNPAINTASFNADFPVDPQNPINLTFDSNPVSTRAEIAQVNVVKSVDQAFAEVGDILTYIVTMTNVGTVPANNAVLTDIVPNGTTFVPGTITIKGIPSGADPNAGIPLGNIPAGGSVTVTFQAEATSVPVPNPAENIGTLSALYPIDPNNPVQRDTDSNPVTTQIEIAELDVVKTVDNAFAEVGDTLTYTVLVTNTGTVTANNVVFTDNPPNGTSFVPGSVTVNGLPVPGNPSFGISLGNIPPGGVVPVTFQVHVDTVPAPNPTTNIGTIAADFPVDPDNPTHKTFDTNPVDTKVEVVDINVVKSADKDFVEVGHTLTYTTVITNTGTVPVDNVIFTDVPPAGTTFIPNSLRINGVAQPGANPSSGVNIGTILPRGFKTVSFRVTVDVLPPGGQITNTASVAYQFRVNPAGPVETRTEPSNPVVTEVELVLLQVIKDVDKTVAVVGDTLTYTVSIANAGTVTAMDVIFTDGIPLGTSLVENSVIVNGVAQPGVNPEAGIPIGDIAPGGFASVVFSVLVEERPEPPEAVNVAVIDFKVQIDPEGPIDERNEVSEPVTTDIEVVELTAVKTVDKIAVNIGDTLTFTVKVTNTGTVPVENVILKDQLPDGTKLVPNGVTVNGIVQPGANPAIGVPLGTIQPGAAVTVKFRVTVESQPCPPELINSATITFNYRLESIGELYSGSALSNQTLTDVGLRIFKQLSVDETVKIPPQKPDAEDIFETIVDVEIVATRIISTPAVTSYEGQKLTNYKMIVEGRLKQKVVYIADEPTQSVHVAHFDVPFSTFLILPETFKKCQRIKVLGFVEDVYSELLDPRTIFKNVTLRLEGFLNC